MKFSSNVINYRFLPNWKMTILAMLAIFLFMKLGFWQINRAHEKKNIIDKTLLVKNDDTIKWTENLVNPESFRKLSLEGSFLQNIFFYDNQHHNHQFGYNVILAFKVDDNSIILIDAGFVKATGSRKSLPEILIPKDRINLTGTVYYPSAKSFTLGDIYEKVSENITIIQQIDLQLISKLLQKSVYPYIIRLDKDEAFGFIREWPMVSMSPNRHYGYAFQWFAFAFVVLILFISLNFKKK